MDPLAQQLSQFDEEKRNRYAAQAATALKSGKLNPAQAASARRVITSVGQLKIANQPKENPAKYPPPSWNEMTGYSSVIPRVASNIASFPGQVVDAAKQGIREHPENPMGAAGLGILEGFITKPMQQDFEKSKEFYTKEQAAAKSGNKEEEVRAAHGKNVHAIGSAVPLVGPMASSIIDKAYGLTSGHEDKPALLDFPAYVLGGKALEAAGVKGVEKGKEVVGETARNYAAKTATKMTTTTGEPGLIPEKETGINIPDRIAEATKMRDVTGLKKSVDVYDGKATAAVNKVNSIAAEADARGVQVTGPVAQALQSRLALLYKMSKQLRDMQALGQTKFQGWGQSLASLKASDILAIKRDLDEVVGYEGGPKKTPVAKDARSLRNQLDESADKVFPGWKDANEQAHALVQAKDALQTRYENAQRGVFKEAAHRLFSTGGDIGASAIGGIGLYESLHAAGLHGLTGYILTGTGLATARFLYNSVPSQMFRIAFADALADATIGRRAALGPNGWPAAGAGGVTAAGMAGPNLPPGAGGGAGQPPPPQAQQQIATQVIQQAAQKAWKTLPAAQQQKLLKGNPQLKGLLTEGPAGGPVGGL